MTRPQASPETAPYQTHRSAQPERCKTARSTDHSPSIVAHPSSVRVVPLPRVVVDALAGHLAQSQTDGFLFTNELARQAGGPPLTRQSADRRSAGRAWTTA